MTNDRRVEAISRLFATAGVDPARAERFLEYSRENGIDVERMWCRIDESDRVVGTVLVVINPGRTAIVFASPVSSSADVSEHGALIERIVEDLRTVDLALLQTLVDPGDHLLARALVAGGFTPLAELSYMERPRRGLQPVPAPTWPEGVVAVPYPACTDAELLRVLESSYVDTLDCPGLRGLRRTEDILEGHRATGAQEPDLWTVLRVDGEPAGAVLLNPAPASNMVELVYIGLAPVARQRGLGRALLRHGLRQVEPRRERAVTLAVDDRNAPAIALYRGEGFRRVLRRHAYILAL